MARIGVDIGHGSNTFPPSKGVYKNGKQYHEHDANSRVASRLEEKLEAAGHTVIKAQIPSLNDVNLTTRTNMYFANRVDLIVSCHANAGVSSADGYASFYWHNDHKAKRLSDLYEQEIKAQGFALWGGSRPSRPNDWSNFHMCRVPASRGVPSILLENGFMTNSKDFEWIFGSKKNEYAERCATAAFNAIQRYLGQSVQTGSKVSTPPKKQTGSGTVSKPSKGVVWVGTNDKGKRVESIYKGSDRLNFYDSPRWDNPSGTFGYGEGWVVDNLYRVDGSLMYRVQNSKGKLYYITASSKYVKVVGGTTKTKAKPKKPISQMADEVIAGKHGNGNETRRKSLGISKAEYEKVRAEVNRRL